MKRFILVTFAFLGWAFYVVSGGAGYEPRPGSLQARNDETPVTPVRVVNEVVIASEDNTVTRAATSLIELDLAKGDDLEITLASVRVDADSNTGAVEDAGIDLEKVAVLTQDIGEDVTEIAFTPELVVAIPRDIRKVTGKLVNMRDGPGTIFQRVGKLANGTEIEVLEDPGNSWVKLQVLETGETGWIAVWLLTPAN